MKEIIDRIYNSNVQLIDYLDEAQQLSFRVNVELNFKKGLLLSISSLFEEKIKEIILSSYNDLKIESAVEFVKNKAISRQYHTFFKWSENNANSFFGLFGRQFKDKMIDMVATDTALRNGVKAFLTLGDLRNKLVHENFAQFSIDKTAREIYDDFTAAIYFIEVFEETLLFDGAEEK